MKFFKKKKKYGLVKEKECNKYSCKELFRIFDTNCINMLVKDKLILDDEVIITVKPLRPNTCIEQDVVAKYLNYGGIKINYDVYIYSSSERAYDVMSNYEVGDVLLINKFFYKKGLMYNIGDRNLGGQHEIVITNTNRYSVLDRCEFSISLVEESVDLSNTRNNHVLVLNNILNFSNREPSLYKVIDASDKHIQVVSKVIVNPNVRDIIEVVFDNPDIKVNDEVELHLEDGQGLLKILFNNKLYFDGGANDRINILNKVV